MPQLTCCVLNGEAEFALDAQELLSLEVEFVYSLILSARLSTIEAEPVPLAMEDITLN